MRDNVLPLVCVSLAAAAMVLAPAAESQPLPASGQGSGSQQTPMIIQGSDTGAGIGVQVAAPNVDWGTEENGTLPYDWNIRVDNPNDDSIMVKVRLEFVDAQGELVQESWVTGQIGPQSAAILQQRGAIDAELYGRIAEGRAVPEVWWAHEPYKFRTVAAFVDGLQRLEVFFVLEDWRGRPVTAAGTVDLYVVERERPRADFDGGGMRRRLSTLYARRFNVGGRDFARRRIGLISTDYSPPALTLGPIHYSIFDREPIGDEGLVRVVFRTASGVEIVGEDRVYF